MTYNSESTTFCDNCGEPTPTIEMYHYEFLPWDIDSANKGESGSLCRECEWFLARGYEK